MRFLVVSSNLILGCVYTSYGILTILDLKRGWRTRGFSHFGAAWIAMAFTCGPHHLEHAIHMATTSRSPGALDFLAVVIGFPAGATWFLLRIEALLGGRGDRLISGTPRWLAALPYVFGIYAAIYVIWTISLLESGFHFTTRMTPNVLLLVIYCLIGYYLLRAQLQARSELGAWSVSGVCLTIVFPTCGLAHLAFIAYGAAGTYDLEWHGLVIDWLCVPAAIYFVWVVRALYLGLFSDWNDAATPVQPRVSV